MKIRTTIVLHIIQFRDVNIREKVIKVRKNIAKQKKFCVREKKHKIGQREIETTKMLCINVWNFK